MTPDEGGETARYWKRQYGEPIYEPSLERVAQPAALRQADLSVYMLRHVARILALDEVYEDTTRLERFNAYYDDRDEPDSPPADAGPFDEAHRDDLGELMLRAYRFVMDFEEFRDEALPIVAKLERAWPSVNTDPRRTVALGWVVDQVRAWIEAREPGHPRVWRDVLWCLEWYGHDLSAGTQTGQPRTSDDLRTIWRRYNKLGQIEKK